MEAVECGAASLAIVLGYYRSFVPLEQLRVECGVSRDGSKASNILKAARKYGFSANGFKKEPDALREMQGPMIIHWNFNHFVVLEGFKRDKVYLNDPGTGPRTVSYEEFDQSFTGVVLTLEPSTDYKAQGEQAGIAGSLRGRLKGSESALLYVILAGLFLVVPGLAIPALTQVFIDHILLGHNDGWLLPILIGMLAAALMRSALAWLQRYYLLRLETKLSLSMSSRFFWHVLRLPVQFFSQRFGGEIGSRVAINDTVAQLLSGELAIAALSSVMIVFYLFLMFQYSVLLTFIAVAAALLNVAFLRFVSRRRVDQGMKLLQDEGKLDGVAMNGLQMIETLKSSGAESDFFAKWAGYQSKLMNAEQQIGVSSGVLGAVPSLLAGISSAAILTVGGLQVTEGMMTIGMLVAFQSLTASFIGPVHQMVGLGGSLQEAKGGLQRLDDVLNHELDSQAAASHEPSPEDGADDANGTASADGRDGAEGAVGADDADVADDASRAERADGGAENAAGAKLAGSVELRNVTFGYNKLEGPLIDSLSLTLRPGSRVAFVGGSGSGKSTIAKLIAGIYQPWSGEILFDGIGRRSLSRSLIGHSLAVVDQDIQMFEGTIRDNLTLWDATIPETDMVRAAKDACIDDEISSRAGGYDYRIAEGGGNFSGGQRQRLEIARALAGNPSILVLDEATSALDPKTEQQVDASFRRRGCTCVIVAHRLSTIRDADEIILLKGGKVVERGTHEELMKAKGEYVKLIEEHI
ncbi:NHLP family bacteriocin export ABC transporter peptidase/permease/ATPase subunit [Cohnella fermenti]|uniref:NHLP family bacteriocin export ABC transporter peptidase/permease/ATPase subunit n=2 Tax=Cohnella fermenti TaxID=2565925 RepID=A0A4S4BQT8_9BACL|nr:NHLP family bacteriocin export ABC transporter peptidase/permease/ATPase subunit [Cohnella fermenti]